MVMVRTAIEIMAKPGTSKGGVNGFSAEYVDFAERLLEYETVVLNREDYLNSSPNIRFLVSNALQNINNTIPHSIDTSLPDGEYICLRYFIDQEKNTIYRPMETGPGPDSMYVEFPLESKHDLDRIVSGPYSDMEMRVLMGIATAEEFTKVTGKIIDFGENPNLVETGLWFM